MSSKWDLAVVESVAAKAFVTPPVDEDEAAYRLKRCVLHLNMAMTLAKQGEGDGEIEQILREGTEDGVRLSGFDPDALHTETFLAVASRMRAEVIREAQKLATAERDNLPGPF